MELPPDWEAFFLPLEAALRDIFLFALFGGEVLDSERTLFSLLARLGGLGIRNPMNSASVTFATSREATAAIVNAIRSRTPLNMHSHV
jgi:hypothetical protein